VTVLAEPGLTTPERVVTAVAQRLRAVFEVLLAGPPPAVDDNLERDAGTVLDLLVRAVHDAPTPDRVWLLYAGVAGTLPIVDDVVEGVRVFQLAGPVEATGWLLDTVLADAPDTAGHEIAVVTDSVVVDVDHSAGHEPPTETHQVARRVLPIWARDHDIVPVAWAGLQRAPRTLSGAEGQDVMRCEEDEPAPLATATRPVTVVPWRTVVVLPETPSPEACRRLAALAQCSGNALVAIGYDCIPAVSADLAPLAEPDRFARYLTVIKHARRLAGVSHTAATEFRGFVDALAAQGLPGPQIVTCPLPTQPVVAETAAPAGGSGDRPLVLCVGSYELRKNHLGVLHAAERLWRDGLAFELRFIGGSGPLEDVPRQIARLRDRGRPVNAGPAVSSTELAASYRRARFTVFPSLHEGYGLPVAESLALGTPVITSNHGGTAEIGAAGGALLLDPQDDEALVDAMRTLLTDDEALRRLREQAEARPVRTWEEYAADLWDRLVAPELAALRCAEPS
jgi:glycosyltransferase involved in cell wall biosynthesis